MTSPADLVPTYSCPCLNVRIFPRAKSVSPEDGWKSVSVDDSGIKIIYEHLTLKSRSVESGQVFSCRLCNATVYRLPDGVDSSASPSSVTTLMTPSRGQDFRSFFQTNKETWIQVCTTQKGTITGPQLDAALTRVSPIFSVIIPKGETMSPSPTPPSSNLSLPTPQPQLVNWPELFPPIPFVPNHPLFMHLARETKKASNARRTAAEEQIRQYIEQKRSEVIEAESGLKHQVQIIWKAFKDPSQDRGAAPQPTDARTHARRQSTAASTGSKSSGPTVIRSFNEQPASSPREARQPAYSSSFSPSTMTPRVHPPISALATSLRQSGMHMPRPESPPSSSLPSAQDMHDPNENGTPKTSTRPKKALEMASPSPLTPSPPKAMPTPSRRPKTSALKRQSMEVKKDGSPDTATTPSESMSPTVGSFPGKRKAVTFSNDEPDVVTVTRQIKAERLQKIKEEHARGEEAMFDLDDPEDLSAPGPSSPKLNSQGTPIGPSPAKKPRVTRRFEGDGDGVKLSFPVSPSKAANGTKKMEYTMARSLPSASILASSSLGLNTKPETSPSIAAVSSLETPYVTELKKMMAGQTPTHRSAWKTGSFDPRPTGSDESDDDGGEESEEDDEETMEQDGEDPSGAPENIPLPSTSVPMDIPPMVRPTVTETSADNDFEGAMSKSVDPGPALELMTDERYYDAAEEEEDLEGDRQAQDLMKKLTEGRGSLYAQRILSHQNRGVPASMWRSVA